MIRTVHITTTFLTGNTKIKKKHKQVDTQCTVTISLLFHQFIAILFMFFVSVSFKSGPVVKSLSANSTLVGTIVTMAFLMLL